MELLPTDAAPALHRDGETSRVFRHAAPWEFLVTGLLFVASGVALWVFREHLKPEGGSRLLFTVPKAAAAAIVLLIWLLIARAFLHSLIGSLRGSNWLMSLGREGIHLNLRSFREHPQDGDAPTVLHLAPSEVDTAGKVSRTLVERSGSETTYTFSSFLELTLAEGVATEHIDSVCRPEAAPDERAGSLRETVTNLRKGVTNMRFRHQPVFTPGRGVLWVEWRRGMLDALPTSIRRVPKRKVRFDPQGVES